MSTFVGTSPFFRRALYVAMETMPFYIAQMGFYSLGQYFSPFKWSPKTIGHTLEVFLMVQGQFNWTLGYAGMCIPSLFIDTKCTVYFCMDIMTYLF